MVSSVDCGRSGVAFVFQTVIHTLEQYRVLSTKATTYKKTVVYFDSILPTLEMRE